MIYLYLFEDILSGIKTALSEGIRMRQRVANEINPLKQRGNNPVKKLVREYRAAKRKPTEQNIVLSRLSHKIGIMYADEAGLPRLSQQIKRHEKKIPTKPKKQLEKPKKPAKSTSGKSKPAKSVKPAKNTP